MKHFQTGSSTSLSFNQLIEEYTLLDQEGRNVYLQSLVERYPWFTLAQYALLRNTGGQEQIQYMNARAPFHTYPAILLDESADIEYRTVDVVNNAIEYFSQIAPPTQSGPILSEQAEEYNEDISAVSIKPDKELVTETLANIYRAQGHSQKAIEVYIKLSMKYPEKSTYYADIINEITAQ